MTTGKTGGSEQHGLGALLRFWREQRGTSQLGLALDAGVSQRHVSFVESGRSVPSREMLLLLAQALDVPLRERNALLLAAGYAPMYAEDGLEAAEMAMVRSAVDRMLQQQEPHPALVLDRYWHVVRTNAAAPRFFGSFVDLEGRPKPRNLLHLMFDPEGMRPFVEHWEEVALMLLHRVRREAVGHGRDAMTEELLESLKRYPGVRELRGTPRVAGPVVPITFRKGDRRWSYFSLVTTVGSPQYVAAQELRVECMFPAE